MAKLEVTVPQESMDRLKALVEVTGAGKLSEVLVDALRLYEAAVNETNNGGTVVVIRADGTHVPAFEGGGSSG